MPSTEKIIDFYHASRPRVTCEMNNENLMKVKSLKDDTGLYLVFPDPRNPNSPGFIFGVPIVITENPSICFRYSFGDGQSIVSSMSGEAVLLHQYKEDF